MDKSIMEQAHPVCKTCSYTSLLTRNPERLYAFSHFDYLFENSLMLLSRKHTCTILQTVFKVRPRFFCGAKL